MPKLITRLKINITFIALTIAAAMLGLFIEFSSEMHKGEYERFDQALQQAAFELRNPELNGIMVDFTALGSKSLLTLFTTFIVILSVLMKKYRVALYMFATMVSAAIGNYYLKIFINRNRPDISNHLVEVSSQSYPSGHTMAAAAFYTAIAIVAYRIVTELHVRTLIVITSALVIYLVGFSRVYLGVHFPTDVLGGLLLGIALSSSMAVALWYKNNQN